MIAVAAERSQCHRPPPFRPPPRDVSLQWTDAMPARLRRRAAAVCDPVAARAE
jgi:hypothetical protein